MAASHLWQLPEIPSAQAKVSKGRYLPEGCSRASPLEEQLLCVKSSHWVPHILKENTGTSSVPSQVKSAAICHQFAQCDQTFQLNLSRWLPSSPAPARRGSLQAVVCSKHSSFPPPQPLHLSWHYLTSLRRQSCFSLAL